MAWKMKRGALARPLIGQVLQRGAVEQVLVIGGGHPVADPARQEDATEDSPDVDGLIGQAADLGSPGPRLVATPLGPEDELLPFQAEHGVGDRAAGNTGDAAHPSQQASSLSRIRAPRWNTMAR